MYLLALHNHLISFHSIPWFKWVILLWNFSNICPSYETKWTKNITKNSIPSCAHHSTVAWILLLLLSSSKCRRLTPPSCLAGLDSGSSGAGIPSPRSWHTGDTPSPGTHCSAQSLHHNCSEIWKIAISNRSIPWAITLRHLDVNRHGPDIHQIVED